VIPDLVSLIDLPPAILNVGEIETPDYMRGRPLQDLLEGEATDWPEEVFLQISESQVGRAIRTKKWKYSVRAPGKEGSVPNSDTYAEDFLYDLEADPHERNNLVQSKEHVDIRERLSEVLKNRMVQAGEQEPTITAQ
jgi:arylsulfatase A-like enzyme